MRELGFEWVPDRWQSWREASNPYRRFKSEQDRTFALEALELRDGDNVLELGCGYGWVSKALLERAKIRWVGLDRSESMIRRLRRELAAHRPSALVADGRSLPFPPNYFDKVLCTGVLMHIDDDFSVLREMERVLRPGGLLLCSMDNILSPASWLEWLRTRLRRNFTQNYRRPRTYRRYLEDLGLRLVSVKGDALVAAGVMTVGPLRLPPDWAFPILRYFDEWVVEKFPALAHELWFAAVKPGDDRIASSLGAQNGVSQLG